MNSIYKATTRTADIYSIYMVRRLMQIYTICAALLTSVRAMHAIRADVIEVFIVYYYDMYKGM
jgi:hypothetical protein